MTRNCIKLAATAALCAVLSVMGAVTSEAAVQVGWASYYKHGARTASGERFNAHSYTAAHKTLPFGTRVKVTNARTGKSVIVRINDRGPFVRGRIIDLSYGAASAVGLTASGVAKVSLEIIQ